MAEEFRSVIQRIFKESPGHRKGAEMVGDFVDILEQSNLLPSSLPGSEDLVEHQDLLSPGQAAAMLGLSRQSVHVLVKQGHMRPDRIEVVSKRKYLLFSAEEVERVRALRYKYPPRQGPRSWNPDE